MRTLLASEDPRARRAVDLYPYRIRREMGSLTAALGGVDAIVFTAGIGANAVPIRPRVCRDAGWLDVERASGANARRPSHQHDRRPGAGMGDPHQRGIDDRTPHSAHARLIINGAL
jgi:acetate kinase